MATSNGPFRPYPPDWDPHDPYRKSGDTFQGRYLTDYGWGAGEKFNYRRQGSTTDIALHYVNTLLAMPGLPVQIADHFDAIHAHRAAFKKVCDVLSVLQVRFHADEVRCVIRTLPMTAPDYSKFNF